MYTKALLGTSPAAAASVPVPPDIIKVGVLDAYFGGDDRTTGTAVQMPNPRLQYIPA